jgi:hypothetical protein
MPLYYITFILPFNESNELDSGEDNYNNDFENTLDLEEEAELPLNEELILLEDNNNPSNNFEPKEETSFINIKEFLTKLTLIKPLKLPLAKIPLIPSKTNTLKPKA